MAAYEYIYHYEDTHNKKGSNKHYVEHLHSIFKSSLRKKLRENISGVMPVKITETGLFPPLYIYRIF